MPLWPHFSQVPLSQHTRHTGVFTCLWTCQVCSWLRCSCLLFLVLGSLFPLMASGPCLDSSSVRTPLRHYSTPSLHSPFLLAHFIASHPPAWKAVMCLFYLFSPGKVNFVHWCVLGLMCTQKTVVILRIHYVKEASVDKDGSQLMKGSPPRKSAFQEHGVGVGWGRLKLLRGSPLFAADIINRKVLLWNRGFKYSLSFAPTWGMEMRFDPPEPNFCFHKMGTKVLIWVWLQNLTMPMIQRVPGNWLLNYLKIMWVYVRTTSNR